MDAVPGGLLPVCHPVSDVRGGDGFLFPWAVITRELGVAGLFSILFFLIILILGLAYAWRKGALEWK